MALLLNIETATKNCSVSISRDDEVLVIKEQCDDYSHAELLNPFIEEVLSESGCSLKQLDCIALSKGPGSYTGLRIGASTAKGLCFGLDKPLVTIGTLDSMAFGMSKRSSDSLLCPMIDARRMEVYAGIYDSDANPVREVQADIVDELTYASYLESGSVIFFGDGAAKCRDVLSQFSTATFYDEFIYPGSGDLAKLAHDKYLTNEFEDVAYFEPYYLKDFVTTTPKKLV